MRIANGVLLVTLKYLQKGKILSTIVRSILRLECWEVKRKYVLKIRVAEREC